eukprot:GHVT01037483.1.p1 GENE.GHVT01037483.1~~GHVT01037483.1.p1  ORF type:complete len:131 (-),score=2.84 GHVT01037483.1:51-443(-)
MKKGPENFRVPPEKKRTQPRPNEPTLFCKTHTVKDPTTKGAHGDLVYVHCKQRGATVTGTKAKVKARTQFDRRPLDEHGAIIINSKFKNTINNRAQEDESVIFCVRCLFRIVIADISYSGFGETGRRISK